MVTRHRQTSGNILQFMPWVPAKPDVPEPIRSTINPYSGTVDGPRRRPTGPATFMDTQY